jgi:hypothetical protein
MSLHECSHCKKVNRVRAFNLTKQPICGACGHDIDDFLFSRALRRIWHRRGLILVAAIFFHAGLILVAATFFQMKQSGRTTIASISAPRPQQTTSPITPQGTTVAPQPREVVPPTLSENDAVLLVADNRPRVVPFTIKTPAGSGGFYVQLTYKGTNRPYMRLFVNAGSSFSTKVALGDYDISFDTGDKWIGLPQQFWLETTTYKLSPHLSSSFSFTATETATETDYSGHAIELIDQSSGNVSKEFRSKRSTTCYEVSGQIQCKTIPR